MLNSIAPATVLVPVTEIVMSPNSRMRTAALSLAAMVALTGAFASSAPAQSTSGSTTSTATVAPKPTRVKSGFNLFKKEQDVEIGQQSIPEVEKQMPVLRNTEITRFVQDMGARLAEHAPGPDFPYVFKVIDASDLNAFALPGGPIYLNRGVLEAARNEGEVAGVLAHEIAHVALRHGTHNASKAYLSQAGLGILGGLLGDGGSSSQIINAVGGFGLNALFLKYSRRAETEADIIGTQIMTRAGYNPADMASFFETLQRADSRRSASFLSSHPPPDRRRERIMQEAKLLPAPAGTTPGAGSLARVKTALARMPPALTMEQIARGQRPSGSSTGETASSGGASSRVPAPSRTLTAYTN